MKTLLTIIAVAMIGSTYADPIQISVSGTADSTLLGYIAGQSYTFNYVLNEAYANTPNDNFISTFNLWVEESTSDTMLFSSISGDGLTGSYTQPSDPYSFMQTLEQGSPDRLVMYAGGDSGNMGMMVNGEALALLYAYNLYFDDFQSPATYTDPATYFSAHVGSYAPAIGGTIRVQGAISGSLYFTPTNVTIIPEPSSTAMIGLVSGLGLFIRRRFML